VTTPVWFGTFSRQIGGKQMAALNLGAVGSIVALSRYGNFMPFKLDETVTVVKLWVYMSSLASNIGMGIYDAAGSGVVYSGPQAAVASDVNEFDIADTELTAGTQYYLCFCCDQNNKSDTVYGVNLAGYSSRALGQLRADTIMSATPPASVTYALTTGNDIRPLAGMTLRTLAA